MTADVNRKENLKPAVFSFGPNKKLRSIVEGGEPWFVAKDVCGALSITRTNDALKKLDDDEKLMRIVSVSGQGRAMWWVNESGLYNMIFRSNKPEAKVFRKWVTAEVLPAIRREGQYVPEKPRPAATPVEQALILSGSQNRLASRIGVSSATITAYLQGGRVLAASMKNRIENACASIAERGNTTDFSTLELLLSVDDKDARLGLYGKLKQGGML